MGVGGVIESVPSRVKYYHFQFPVCPELNKNKYGIDLNKFEYNFLTKYLMFQSMKFK